MSEEKVVWRLVKVDEVLPVQLSSDVEAYLVAELPHESKFGHVLEVLAYFPVLPEEAGEADHARMQRIRALIAGAPRALRALCALSDRVHKLPKRFETDLEWAELTEADAILRELSGVERRCDCESSVCKVGHPFNACTNRGEVKTIHSTICRACAEYMPSEYLEGGQ